ncbi:hypothetical protein ACRCMW_08730 [Enterobacter chengduensis]|uniref:hypothetical protein n=1 Tax=Enterobacter cloacae complex TaxID=354276 RepID=UPI00207D1216|nr:hypothetical protein [Enterobacter hormaechei]MCO0811092.1 hypothetical protein [Enterobacter hormaechei]HCD7317589.1 hypothetical protein [Enterobacter chengduensis]HDU4639576.1 hypothetical protein [Klebsiella aerogenes]
MTKQTKTEKANELIARRKRDVEYQNKRKDKLEKLGKHSITIRLDDVAYKSFSDICEILGYQRPEEKKRNLIETYSASLIHLLRIEREEAIYRPKSRAAKKFYRLYKIVNHLKYDKKYSDNEIITFMKSEKIATPSSTIKGSRYYLWSDKSIEKMLNEEKVIDILKNLDEGA